MNGGLLSSEDWVACCALNDGGMLGELQAVGSDLDIESKDCEAGRFMHKHAWAQAPSAGGQALPARPEDPSQLAGCGEHVGSAGGCDVGVDQGGDCPARRRR